MAKIDALNQRIIAQSVQTKINKQDVPKKVEQADKTEKKEGVSDKSKNYKIAAAAVASVAVAGILIANRNRIGNLFKGARRNSEKASSLTDDASKTIGKENKPPKVDTPQADTPVPKTEEKPQTPNVETPAQKADEPIQTPEKPANSSNEPTKAPEEPANVPEEPAKVPEGPTKAPEGPAKAPEEPAKVPEESANVPSEPAKTPENSNVNPDNKKTELNSNEVDEADEGFNFDDANEVIYNPDDAFEDEVVKTPVKPRVIDKIVNYPEGYEQLRREKEAPIMDKVKEVFKRFRDDAETAPEFNANRPINVVFSKEIAPPIKPDLRELEDDDFDAVISFLDNYQYNSKMRAGVDVSDVDEVKRLNKLINEAEPLEEETYVYRAIRTHELWGDHNEYEFAKDMNVGDILKDRAFVATSRAYDVDIAGGDPKNWDERLENYGLIMRIRLPKGTKGLDCRRCSMRDSDRGSNATYILPPGAEFKIRAFDFPRRIMSCDYILPNS